ncbi:MAG: sensor histidine kinase N-terminal domain-containing protein [Gammaproteobacteria bacterium]|nr:sensor histidine kinase N-terminal domain-containing protein [Gammaproteobacteria bacterium]
MSGTAPSIRRRLLVMLISALLLVWLVVVLLVYRAAQHEVEEVFDADLERSARILQALLSHEVEEEKEMLLTVRDAIDELGSEGLARYPHLASILQSYTQQEARERLELVGDAQSAGHRYGAGLIFIVRYADGSMMLRDTAAPEVPPTAPGFSDVRIDERDWRIFSLREARSGLTVQVGERHAFRSELVRYITRNTLMPLLVALPVLAVLVWIVVGRALAPLQQVAQEVSRRAPDALDPIDDDGAPREISSLLRALNKLFERVDGAMARERQFTADAAHELRTPLAALKTHLQVARGNTTEPATRESLNQALAGVDRATHSVEQMLMMARADAQQSQALVNARVDLRSVVVAVVSSMSQLAHERDIDLGVEGDDAVIVRGDESALHVLVRNLVDNALRYTPPGGSATVAVGRDASGPFIAVLDSGPGIAEEERGAVFSRFRRGAGEQAAGTVGSGLGLSIVQRIARLHGATITLGEGIDNRGLSVKVSLPEDQSA